MHYSKNSDFFNKYNLKPIEIEDKNLFNYYFSFYKTRIAEYSFANIFIWRKFIKILWKMIDNHICVFANGDNGLTMPLPPLGQGNINQVLDQCMEICRNYNFSIYYNLPARIEYLSKDLLNSFNNYTIEPMQYDYIYETKKMILLEGGDLASKRQLKNRFMRKYKYSTENYDPEKHFELCLSLLKKWSTQTKKTDLKTSVTIKRLKEILATEEALRFSKKLGLSGMVLFAEDNLIGFTLGEMLGSNMFSILIEKTDREYTGSAQFIFSEFCKNYWSNVELCNVGDDWDVPSLRWTKNSYKPAFVINKWMAIDTVFKSKNKSYPISTKSGCTI